MESRKDLRRRDRGLVTMESLLTQGLLISRCLDTWHCFFLCVLKIEFVSCLADKVVDEYD